MPGPPKESDDVYELGAGNRRQCRRKPNQVNSYYVEELDNNGDIVPRRHVSKLNRPEIIDLFLVAMEQPGPDPTGWMRVP